MSSVIVVKHGFRRAVIAAGLRGAPGTGGSGSAGVTKFNNRTGAVTLNGADVTTALGYTPANNASLAAVAFSGAYVELTGRPFIPAAPGDIGAASAAQGALAGTAVQPAALTVLLDLKVDKIAGYGLSQENFTPAEKAKLAGLDGGLWKGTYASLGALQTAHPTAEPGSSAHVDVGVGAPVALYIWDDDDDEWVAAGGAAAPLTAAQVKTLYESNADTNAYTDAEKAKLGGVAAGATANADTDSLSEGATNKWFTAARVLATLLSGLSLAAATAVVDTDSVLAGIGKLQRQINDLVTALSGKQETLVSATNIKTVGGTSILGAGDIALPAAGMTNPMTAAGDLILGGAAGAPGRLAKGPEGSMLVAGAGFSVAYSFAPMLGGYRESVENMATNAINVSIGCVKKRVLTAAATITISGQVAGLCSSFTLLLEGGNSHAVTWPASFKWMGGVPTLTAKDVITGFTIDNGVTWVVSYAGSYV